VYDRAMTKNKTALTAVTPCIIPGVVTNNTGVIVQHVPAYTHSGLSQVQERPPSIFSASMSPSMAHEHFQIDAMLEESILSKFDNWVSWGYKNPYFVDKEGEGKNIVHPFRIMRQAILKRMKVAGVHLFFHEGCLMELSYNVLIHSVTPANDTHVMFGVDLREAHGQS
jgi:hypothetical protein